MELILFLSEAEFEKLGVTHVRTCDTYECFKGLSKYVLIIHVDHWFLNYLHVYGQKYSAGKARGRKILKGAHSFYHFRRGKFVIGSKAIIWWQ